MEWLRAKCSWSRVKGQRWVTSPFWCSRTTQGGCCAALSRCIQQQLGGNCSAGEHKLTYSALCFVQMEAQAFQLEHFQLEQKVCSQSLLQFIAMQINTWWQNVCCVCQPLPAGTSAPPAQLSDWECSALL